MKRLPGTAVVVGLGRRSLGFTGIPSEAALRRGRGEEPTEIDYTSLSDMLDADAHAPVTQPRYEYEALSEEARPERGAHPQMFASANHIDRLRKDYFKFGKSRPLPQVPWLQDTRRTYLDDAERMFGRKEQWQNADHDTRMKLIVILREAIQDTVKSSNELSVHTRERERKLGRLAKEYASFVVAGAEDPTVLKGWRRPKSAADILQEEEEAEQTDISSLREYAASRSSSSPPQHQDDKDAEEIDAHVDSVRQGMLNGHLGDGAATEGLNRASLRSTLPGSQRPYSQFPFLRKRVMDDAESLDPSLVDWTKQYFPNDDEETFALPPSLLKSPLPNDDDIDSKDVNDLRAAQAVEAKQRGEELSPRDRQLVAADGRRRRRRGVGRAALTQSLSQKVNSRMSVFDAEGVHYRRVVDIARADPSPGGAAVDAEGIPRTQRPRVLRMRRATDVREAFLDKRYHGGTHGGRRAREEAFSAETLAGDKATRVDWNSVSAQRGGAQGFRGRGPQWHRANERLIRMTRGESGDRL